MDTYVQNLDTEAGMKKSTRNIWRPKHPLYWTWSNMKARCYNKAHTSYKYYGGRGITVCDRWMVFSTFLEDMGEKPTPTHTIDRIDNNKGYSKENCRWATKKEQIENRSFFRKHLFNGAYLSTSEISKLTGIAVQTLNKKILRGYDISNGVVLWQRKQKTTATSA